eukprot:TRINITY_DN286_c0_g1_i1.p1 TRINITY_DN286_c0_g1~~TRINITY_DN286_c0_g1_i1.p1  ORF type:complete len:317 (+),score=65.96 TRINITY_DN286_c0_g1_i1:110-1060(+)
MIEKQLGLGKQICEIETSIYINPLQYSPDSNYLATSDDSCNIFIFDVRNGYDFLRRIESYDSHTTFTFSNDSTLLAASYHKRIDIHNVKDSSCEVLRIDSPHTAHITGLSFSPYGNMLAYGDAEGNVVIYDLKSNTELQRRHCMDGFIWNVIFSHDGALLAISSLDKEIKLFDFYPNELHLRETYTDQLDEIRFLQFDPSDSYLVSCCQDGSTFIRDWRNSRSTIINTDVPNYHLAFMSVNKDNLSLAHVFYCANYSRFFVYSIESGLDELSFDFGDRRIRSFAFSNDLQHVVIEQYNADYPNSSGSTLHVFELDL